MEKQERQLENTILLNESKKFVLEQLSLINGESKYKVEPKVSIVNRMKAILPEPEGSSSNVSYNFNWLPIYLIYSITRWLYYFIFLQLN